MSYWIKNDSEILIISNNSSNNSSASLADLYQTTFSINNADLLNGDSQLVINNKVKTKINKLKDSYNEIDFTPLLSGSNIYTINITTPTSYKYHYSFSNHIIASRIILPEYSDALNGIQIMLYNSSLEEPLVFKVGNELTTYHILHRLEAEIASVFRQVSYIDGKILIY